MTPATKAGAHKKVVPSVQEKTLHVLLEAVEHAGERVAKFAKSTDAKLTHPSKGTTHKAKKPSA